MKASRSGSQSKVVTTSCYYDCGGRCLLKVYVDDGKITRIGTDERPMPSLKACPRGLAQKEVVYAADRLKQPKKEKTGAALQFPRLPGNRPRQWRRRPPPQPALKAAGYAQLTADLDSPIRLLQLRADLKLSLPQRIELPGNLPGFSH